MGEDVDAAQDAPAADGARSERRPPLTPTEALSLDPPAKTTKSDVKIGAGECPLPTDIVHLIVSRFWRRDISSQRNSLTLRAGGPLRRTAVVRLTIRVMNPSFIRDIRETDAASSDSPAQLTLSASSVSLALAAGSTTPLS